MKNLHLSGTVKTIVKTMDSSISSKITERILKEGYQFLVPRKSIETPTRNKIK